VDEEVGVAADRRGEVGVGAQRQSEVAVILRAVIGLGLGAQDLLHHLRAEIGVSDAFDDAVEGGGADHLPERELDLESLEVVLERDQLLAAGRFVDAVHDRSLLRLQRLGGGDVGGDHIILDQLVRIEALARGDRGDAPFSSSMTRRSGRSRSSGARFSRAAYMARQQSHRG
jgi:hypothetical protein